MPVQPVAAKLRIIQFSHGWGVVVAGLVSEGMSLVGEPFVIGLSIGADELALPPGAGIKLD